MLKKLLAFLCGLAPVGAVAAVPENINVTDIKDLAGYNASESSNVGIVMDDAISIGADQIVAVQDAGITALTTKGALDVTGDMRVFDTPIPQQVGGTLFVSNDVSNTFSLQTDADVTVGGDLTINGGRTFNITNYTDGSTFDVSIGSVISNAVFNVTGVRDFTAGTVDTDGDIKVIASNDIAIGAVTVEAGDAVLTAGNTLNIAGALQNNGVTYVDLTADTISVGSIQNNANGEMTIDVAGDLSATGVIENKGQSLIINAAGADIVVDETMTNESGKMTITADSLTVNGGDNASFVNNADLSITVTGATTLAKGFDLVVDSDKPETFDNNFYLNTGSLNLGTGNTTAFFANNLNSYNVIINSAFVTGDVSNGLINADANMSLSALDLTVEDVVNYAGAMDLTAADNLIAKSVSDVAGATTNLIADGNISITDTITANSTMNLRGQQISAGGIVVNAGDLNVLASTGESGLVTINGDVVNNAVYDDAGVLVPGTVNISGRQINVIGNVNNEAGDLTVGGSDLQENAIHFGGVSVAGGVATMGAALGIDISQTKVGEDMIGTGTLSVTDGVLNLTAGTHSLTVGGVGNNSGYVVDIAGDIVASAAQGTSGTGDVYVNASGNQGFTLNANGAVNVGGDVLATTATTAGRTLIFASKEMSVDGDVNANGSLNKLVFQGHPSSVIAPLANTYAPVADLTVGGELAASNAGVVEISSTDITVGSLTENNGAIYVYGDGTDVVQMDVTDGDVYIQNGITFNSATSSNKGLIIANTSTFDLRADASNQNLDVFGGVDVGAGATLSLNVGFDMTVSGATNIAGKLDANVGDIAEFTNDMTVAGDLDVDAKYIYLSDVENSGGVSLNSDNDVTVGILENTQNATSLDIVAGGAVNATAIEAVAGESTIIADSLNVDYGMDITGGTFNLDTLNGATFGGVVNVSGVLNQGANNTGMLNLNSDNLLFAASGLTVDGFVADSNFVTYDISGDIVVDGDMTVGTSTSLATVHMNSETFDNVSGDENDLYTFRNYGAFKLASTDTAAFDNVINTGALTIDAPHGITMASVQNSGDLSLDSGKSTIDVASLEVNGGTIQLYGTGLNLASELTTVGNLYQNYTGTLAENDIGISANDYAIAASNVTVFDINQMSGAMQILSSDVVVNGDINATDLTIAANPDSDWLNLEVSGNVSGGTKIWNLGHMVVGGDYIFDQDSQLLVGVSDYSGVAGGYWADVDISQGTNLGKITNATDGTAGALIQLENGKFTSGTQYDSGFTLNTNEVALADGQIGLKFKDVENLSASTAIWLLEAKGGLAEFSSLEKIRNLNVLFCNAGNTKCVALNSDNLGAYISVRDSDNSGSADSLYVVFDPRFGGPVLFEDNRIQPIVARQPEYTTGEYVAAGALDNLIAGQLVNSGFFNKSPIEVIPVIFEDTNLETLMSELYNRMEHYVESADGSSFVPFSRLVQPREIEQIAGAIALNEHVSFRNFEDRMIDEFIWNRNRNLKKAWVDFNFGMFSQNVADSKRVYGNRFELSGGFDWQSSNTLVLGLTGRVSHMSSDNSDSMDLGYLPGESVAGNVAVDVADTNVGLGAYLIKTLGHKFRLYGNAFADLHLLDTTRHMTFMDTIEGSGTALALTTEWGLMHDWLNQYVVGNLYARAGYNFGFSVTEEAAGENYMDMESDGYLMLTPGYSLTAQKRIYPTAWFQIRPYATIGVEYDVLGVPDFAKYKFAAANTFSKYDIEIDPLWANIGGGFEFLSASGVQFGIDYRYQYNNDMQLHNIKVSGSYRF